MKKIIIVPSLGLVVSAPVLISATTIKQAEPNIQENAFNVSDVVIPNEMLEDIVLQSEAHEKEKRIYVDSSSDNVLPGFNSQYDVVKSKAQKNVYYDNEFTIGVIDVLKYSNSREEFIKEVKTINIDLELGRNFWDSKYGWENSNGSNGKTVSYKTHCFNNWKLSNNSIETTKLVEYNNEKHATREYVKLSIKQEWSKNSLTFRLVISGKVTWSGGSIYNHAALLGIRNEKITIFKRV